MVKGAYLICYKKYDFAKKVGTLLFFYCHTLVLRLAKSALFALHSRYLFDKSVGASVNYSRAHAVILQSLQ